MSFEMSFVYVPTPDKATWTKSKDKQKFQQRFKPYILLYQFRLNFFSLFDDRCFKCKRPCNWISDTRGFYEGALHQWELDMDHNLPFELGGRLEEGNIVALCKTCNSKKNKKHPEEFYSDNELESLERYLITQADLFPKKNYPYEEKRDWYLMNKKEKKKMLIEEYGIDEKLVELTGSIPADGIHNYAWCSHDDD